jgi:hypothetical protein
LRVRTVVNVWVRQATLDDAPCLAKVHVLGWRAAYRGLMPQVFLDGLDPAVRERTWRRWLADPQPPAATAVVEDEDEGVVGFANLGASRDPGARPGTGEVAAI